MDIKRKRYSQVKPTPVIVRTNLRDNGDLKSIYQVIDKRYEGVSRANVPYWCIGLGSLFCLAILTTLIASLVVVYFAPRPGLYTESCQKRSCVKDLNLKCIDGTCQCSTGYFYTTKCIPKKEYNEKCHLDSYCADEKIMVCRDGVCKCNETKYWDGLKCVNKKTLNKDCKNDEQCLDNSIMYCSTTSGKCTCATNRFWDGSISACVPKRTINEVCDGQKLCLETQYLVCTSGTCKCNSTQYWNGQFSLCRNKHVENQTCSSTLQCISPMNCTSNSMCQCQDKAYHDISTLSCIPQKTHLENCAVEFNCRVDKYLDCIAGKCQCIADYPQWSTERDMCIFPFTYTQACLYQSDCDASLSLICNSGTNCTCPTPLTSGYCDCVRVAKNESYWDGSSCTPANSYNGACTGNHMCKILTEGTLCISSLCKCRAYFFFYYGNNTCQSQVLNGIACPQTDECRSDLGLLCVSGTCQCNTATQFWNGTRCVTYYTYNSETCTNDIECKGILVCKLSGSSCSCPTGVTDGKCDCPVRVYGTEYYWSGSDCVSAKVYNASCGANYECKTLTEKTTCSSSRCTCVTYSYFYFGNRTCQNQVLNGESCPQTDECRVDLGLSCVTGTCQCNTATQFWNGTRCVNYYTYNSETCTNDIECKGILVCKLSGSSCSCPTGITDGKCDCPVRVYGTEYYWDGSNCISAKVYNASCGANYECKTLTEKTTCSGSLCTCATYSYFYFGNRTCQSQLLDGDSCPQTDECRVDLGLSCVSGTCQCNTATQFWNGTRCVNYYTYNSETCTNDIECKGLLVCKLSGSSCTCPTGIVTNGKCDCPLGVYGAEYYWNGSNCVSAKVYNSSCGANYECQAVTEKTVCSGSRCICATHSYFYFGNRTCQSQVLNGIACPQTDECRTDLGLSCVSGTCQCNTATQFWNGTRCVNYYTYNSETCTSDIECKGMLRCKLSGASCNCGQPVPNTKCDCPVPVSGAEYYWNGTDCVLAAPYGESCLANQNYSCQSIREKTYCNSSGQCDCNNGFFNVTICVPCKSSSWKYSNGYCYYVSHLNNFKPVSAIETSATIQTLCDNTPTAKFAKIIGTTLTNWLFSVIPSGDSGDKFYVDAFRVSGTTYKSKDLTWSLPNQWCSGPSGADECIIYKRGGSLTGYCFEEHDCNQHGHNLICEYKLAP